MNVIILILKIIGIILLVLLGILVVTVSVALVMPAKYQIKANAKGDIKSVSASASAFWLFHLLSISASYTDGQFQWKARVFWKKYTEENQKLESEQEKKPVVKKKKVKVKPKGRFDKFKYTFNKIYDKIKWIWKNKDEFITFINDNEHQATFGRLKKDVLVLVKHFRPRKMKGYVRYGLEDPYRTGQILAVLSVLYPFYGSGVDVYPDFEEEILEGDLKIVGHIRPIHFLRMVRYLIFDKTVKDIFQYVEKMQTQK